VVHDHHDAAHARHEVHGAAHALHELAGDHPVGEVALLATSMAPRIAMAILPPRIMAKEVAESK
jgi:hypothetical protein